jgi:Holliday junction DNA helicase RuvA
VYHHLRGKVVDVTPTSLVLEVGGVGYDVRIPLSTYEVVKGSTEATVYTHLHVREDDLKLFGFATRGERELFRVLLAVSGVGPSIAISALCALAPGDVARAIAASDHKALQKIKGVGKKLAERITLELRDRAGELLVLLGIDASQAATQRAASGGRPASLLRSAEAQDAIAALMALGFERKSAEDRIDSALRHREERGGGAAPVNVEVLIKESLRSGSS